MLVGRLNWRACCCPSKGGVVLPKVAFLATIVASAVAFHAQADIPQVGASTYVTLHSALLGRKAPRPLGLVVGPIIWSPPLLMP